MLYGLQHLRFIAALIVVFHHSIGRTFLVHGITDAPRLSFGAAGVDIFFVISGFIMIYVLEKGGAISGLHFFAKRMIRVAPPYWIVTFWALYLNAYSPSWFFGPDDPWIAVKSVFFLPTARTGPNDLVPLVQPGWSLNFEVLFYALISLGVMFAKQSYALFAICGLITIFIISSVYKDSAIVWKMYSAYDGILLEFIFGILLGHIYVKQGLKENVPIGLILITLGSILLIFAWNSTAHYHRFIYIGSTSFLIVAGFLMSEPLWRASISRRMVIFGNSSYSLYLSHLFVIIPLVRYMRKTGYADHAWANPYTTELLFLLSTIAVGIAFHILIEKPSVKITRAGFGALAKWIDRAKFWKPRGR